VEAHLRALYRKLGVHSRTAAARYAVEHGLTDGE
jgi:DNA-binding NarL/FixJ family response regulator